MSTLAILAARQGFVAAPAGPPPAEGDTPNEPADYTRIVNRSLATIATTSTSGRGTGAYPDKLGGSEGWDDVEYKSVDGTQDTNLSLDLSATWEPINGRAMRITYPVGLAQNTGPLFNGTPQTLAFNGAAHGNLALHELYTSQSVYLGPTYWAGGVSNKLWMHRSTDLGGGGDNVRCEPFLALFNNGAGGLKVKANFQGAEDNPLGFFDPIAGTVGEDLQRETKYLVETQLIMNSAVGVGDGVFRAWVDGELVIERTDVKMRPAAETGDSVWSAWHAAYTFGGNSAPNDTEFWIEHGHVFISGKA